ncbi:hypothetical protein D3C75_1149120 [compost metagenome]
MVNRILNERLQRQLRNRSSCQFRRNINFIAEYIRITYLHNGQIIVRDLCFLFQNNKFPALVEYHPVKIRQRLGRIPRLFVAVKLVQDINRIQRVI